MAQKWEVQSKRDANECTKTGSPDTRLKETAHGTHTKEASCEPISKGEKTPTCAQPATI